MSRERRVSIAYRRIYLKLRIGFSDSKKLEKNHKRCYKQRKIELLVTVEVMKKETDRTRRWRARKKAEGKSSFTVLLSREAKAILTEEKAKTGESYSVIVDKALHVLKKHGYRSSVFKPFPKLEDIPATVLTNNSQPPVVAEKKTESGGKQRILIDDLANYPTEDVKRICRKI
jgi:predicted Zn-dependent protease